VSAAEIKEVTQITLQQIAELEARGWEFGQAEDGEWRGVNHQTGQKCGNGFGFESIKQAAYAALSLEWALDNNIIGSSCKVPQSRLDSKFDLALLDLLCRNSSEESGWRDFIATNPDEKEIRSHLSNWIGPRGRVDSRHGIIQIFTTPKIALYWQKMAGHKVKPTLEGSALIVKIRELFAAKEPEPEPAKVEPQTPVTNPFRESPPDGWKGIEFVETVDAQDRLEKVREFDAEQLRAVMALPGVQKIVRQAAERRLRKLESETKSPLMKSTGGRWDGSKRVPGGLHNRSYRDLSLIELEEARGCDLSKMAYEQRQHFARLRDEYNRRFGLAPNENGVYVGCEGIEPVEYRHRTGAEIKIALLESPVGWMVSMSVGVKGTGAGCFGSSEPLSAVDVYETREAALRSRLERVDGHCERNRSDSKKAAEAKNLMRKWAKAQIEKLEESAPESIPVTQNASTTAVTDTVETVVSLTLQPSLFDYSTLDEKTAEVVQYAASEIKRLYRLTVENAIEIGLHLRDVKRRLHGRYTEWLKAEFEMSERTARDFVSMADEFGDRELPENLSLTVVRVLAQPSTPRAAREEVIERAKAGEQVTVEETRQTVTKHTQKRWAQASILEEPGVIEESIEHAEEESKIIAESGFAPRTDETVYVSEEMIAKGGLIDLAGSTMLLSAGKCARPFEYEGEFYIGDGACWEGEKCLSRSAWKVVPAAEYGGLTRTYDEAYDDHDPAEGPLSCIGVRVRYNREEYIIVDGLFTFAPIAENSISNEIQKSAIPSLDSTSSNDEISRLRVGDHLLIEYPGGWENDTESLFYSTLQAAIDDSVRQQSAIIADTDAVDPATNPRNWLREEWKRSRLIMTIIVEPESKGSRRVSIKASLTGKYAEQTAQLDEMVNFERGPVAAVLNSLRKQSRKDKVRTTTEEKARSRKAKV